MISRCRRLSRRQWQGSHQGGQVCHRRLPSPYAIGSLLHMLFLQSSKGIIRYFRNPLVHSHSAICVVAQQLLDIFFQVFRVQSTTRDHQRPLFSSSSRSSALSWPQCTLDAPLDRSNNLQTDDSEGFLFFRRRATSSLKVLVELTPPLCSVQQCAQRSLVCPLPSSASKMTGTKCEYLRPLLFDSHASPWHL